VAAAYAEHPDIRNAAIAGLNGHGDFMALLALPAEQYEIAVAVVSAQQDVLDQRRRLLAGEIAAALSRLRR
jgi:sulfate adenylyltransferase subunit 1 (EFTu-like GTPase family)